MWQGQGLHGVANASMVNTSKQSAARVAVIGVGGWGKNHVRVLSEMGVLAAICDSSEERAKDFAAKYHTQYYTSVDDMLRDELELYGCVI